MLCTSQRILHLPRETRVALLICGTDTGGRQRILAWLVKPLLDEKGFLIAGQHQLRVWPNHELLDLSGKKKSKRIGSRKSKLVTASKAAAEAKVEADGKAHIATTTGEVRQRV